MALKQIGEEDLAGRGLEPLPSVPGLPAEDMKRKFEELVREVVIPAVNHNARECLDRDQVQAKINRAVFETGASDMAKAVYDPESLGENMYTYAKTWMDAEAWMEGSYLRVRSRYPVHGDSYTLQFNSPQDLETSGLMLSIDGTWMMLRNLNNKSLATFWKAGTPVILMRRGRYAYYPYQEPMDVPGAWKLISLNPEQFTAVEGAEPRYMKDGRGWVQVSGMVLRSQNITTSTVLGAMPDACQPEFTVPLTLTATRGATVDGVVQPWATVFRICTDGYIRAGSPAASVNRDPASPMGFHAVYKAKG